MSPAGVLNLPLPGTMVPLTSGFNPAVIQGITVHPQNPLEFDFIIHPGDRDLNEAAFEDESKKLIKYFLAALTIPEDQLWVNLSPYEENRIISREFGHTEMGRDLLAQDYLLKQLTASLMYPEEELGQEFWTRVHKEAQNRFGTTEIPMNTFNKIWIVPEKAVVHRNGESVFVVESKLKVLLEEDYVALEHHALKSSRQQNGTEVEDIVSGVSSEIVREILIPAIEREVNEGETFANLRQIFHSLILAAWYKQNLKESFLGEFYIDQGKTKGIETDDEQVNQKIYDQYIMAFKKGVYNYIREDVDPGTNNTIPRKYFSGGVDYAQLSQDIRETGVDPVTTQFSGAKRVRVSLDGIDQNGRKVDISAITGLTKPIITDGGDQAALSKVTDRIKAGFGISGDLTRNALAKAVVKYYKTSSASEGNDFTRALASLAVDAMDIPQFDNIPDVPEQTIKVAGAVISSTLDVTLIWETQKDGQLTLVETLVEAGGGPVNSAKTFTNHDVPFGITALSSSEPLQLVWESTLPQKNLKKYFAESNRGKTKVNLLNIVDGERLKVFAGRGEPISDEMISRFLLKFESMLAASSQLEWLMLTAGGRVLYDRSHYLYGTMIEKAHEYGLDVLIDFKYTSTKKEIQSVLDVERKQPQDILSPNIREFIILLEKLDLVEANTLKRSMRADQIELYARRIIDQYNLKGILITRDEEGLIFVPREGRMIIEPGIPVSVKSITGAGDAASAGFIMALIQGKTYAEASKEANIFGASTVTLLGSQVASKESLKRDNALFAVTFDEGVHTISRWITDKLKTKREDEPLVIAINGASGSGKTTLKKIIVAALKQRGFEKDKDNIYTHIDSQRYIHYYEELWESMSGPDAFDELWEKDFYGHKGIVIVESVVKDVPAEWHNRQNLLLVHMTAGLETRKARLIGRGSSEQLALEKAAYDNEDYDGFAKAISINNDDRIMNMLFLGIQKFLYSYDQAVLADAGDVLKRAAKEFNRIYQRKAFDSQSLSQMYRSAVKIAEAMQIKDIEGQRLKRLADSGGYEKGFLLFREREPGGGIIVEDNKKGRLLRDGTLQPRIDQDTVSDQLGDWVKATETQRIEALKDKLKEEFDDIVREGEQVLAGQTGRLNRLTVVLTNFMEAIRSLQSINQDSAVMASVTPDPFEQRLLALHGVTHLDRHTFNQALLTSGINPQVIMNITDQQWEELKGDIERGLTVNDLLKKGYRAKLGIGSGKRMTTALQLLTKKPKPLAVPVIPIFAQHWGKESALKAAAEMMEQYARLVEARSGGEPKVIWIQEDIGADLRSLEQHVSFEQMTRINATFERIFEHVKDQHQAPYLTEKILTDRRLIDPVTAIGITELLGIFTSLKESSASITREKIIKGLEVQSRLNQQEGRVDHDLEFNLALLKSLDIYSLEFHREIEGMSFLTFLNLLWSDYIQLLETMAYLSDRMEDSRKLRRWSVELYARSNMIERDLGEFIPLLQSLAERTAKTNPDAVIVFVRGIEHERVNQFIQPQTPRPLSDGLTGVNLAKRWKDHAGRVSEEDIDIEFITHVIENVATSVGLNSEEIVRRGLKVSGIDTVAGQDLRRYIQGVYKNDGYPNGLMISFAWLLKRLNAGGESVMPGAWDDFIQQYLADLRIAQYRETAKRFYRDVSEQFRSEEFRMAVVQYYISSYTMGMDDHQRRVFVELALKSAFGNKSGEELKAAFPSLFDDQLLDKAGDFSGWLDAFVRSGYVRGGLPITPNDIASMAQWWDEITGRLPFLLPVRPRVDSAMLADVPDVLTVNQQRLRLLPLSPDLMINHKRSLAELIGFMSKNAAIWMLERDLEEQAKGKIQYDPELSYVVLAEDGSPVGMSIAYQPHNKNYVYLSSFSVNPNLHGTAVSSWLLYRTFRAAYLKGLKTAQWDTYPKLTGNEYARANGFYKHVGAYPVSVQRDGIGLHMEYVQDLTTLLPRIYDYYAKKEPDYAMFGNTSFHQTISESAIKNILLKTELGRPVLKVTDGAFYELGLDDGRISETVLTDEAFDQVHRRNPHPVIIGGRDSDIDHYLNRIIPEEVTIRVTHDGVFVNGIRQDNFQTGSHDLIHLGYAISREDTEEEHSYVLDVVSFQTLVNMGISPRDNMMDRAYEELVVRKVENYYMTLAQGKSDAVEKLDRELDRILSIAGWTKEDFEHLVLVVEKLRAEFDENGFVEITHRIRNKLTSADLTVSQYDQQGELLEDAAMLADMPMEIILQGRTFRAAHLTPALLNQHQDAFAALMVAMNPRKTFAQMQDRIAHLAQRPDEFNPLYSLAVLDQDGNPVGMTLAERSSQGDYLYLSTFVVDPKLQGSPLASWLLYHTFYNAHADGLDTARWETFPADESDVYRRANAFYRKIGAVPVKDTAYTGFRRMEFVYDLTKGLSRIMDEYTDRQEDFAIMGDDEGISRERNNDLPKPVYTMGHVSYAGRTETFLNWLKQQTYLPLADLEGSAVVDIGSSYGFGTVELAGVLADVNSAVHVYGVDRAPGLDGLRRTLRVPDNVTFIKDDHRLTGAQRPKNIKMIVSMNMFMYYDAAARRTMLAQMNEYLEEGGLMVLGVGGPGEKNKSLNFLVLQKQDGQIIPRELVFNRSFYSFSTEQAFSYWQGYFSGDTAQAFHSWASDVDEILKEERRTIRRRLFAEGFIAWDRQEPEIFQSQQKLLKAMGFVLNSFSDGSVGFPLNQIFQAAEVAAAGDQAMTAQRPRILVVDDYESIRKATRALLRSMDYEVLTAVNGTDALKVIDEELRAGRFVDLVLTDMNMPEMNGEQLITHLKGDLRYASIPVIMNLAAEQDVIIRLKEKLGVPILSKPFDSDTLLALMQTALPDAGNMAAIPTREDFSDVLTAIDVIFAGAVAGGQTSEARLKEAEQAMMELQKVYPNPYLVHFIQDRLNYLGAGMVSLIPIEELSASILKGRENLALIGKGLHTLGPVDKLPVIHQGFEPEIDHEKIAQLGESADEAALASPHEAKITQLISRMGEISTAIYYSGPTRAQDLVDLAISINSNFQHPFKPEQIAHLNGEQFERLIRLVNEQVMIPARRIINSFRSDGTADVLTIDRDSWKEEPYLGKLSIWTADVTGLQMGMSDAFALGWFAFVDHQNREKFYRDLYQQLQRGVQYNEPNGITALYGRLFKNLNLSEQEFVQIMTKNVWIEEKIHARDAAYTAGLKGDYRTFFEKAPEILIAQTITRSEFEVLQRGEGEPDRLNWLAVMEFSAKLQGVILEMEEYLKQGREDLAYFLFFDYIRNQIEFLTSHNEYNHNVALYFIDELLDRNLGLDQKLLGYLNRDPDVHPAQQALALLKEIYTKHFYTEEERLQKLIEKGRDKVNLLGPNIDEAMLAGLRAKWHIRYLYDKDINRRKQAIAAILRIDHPDAADIKASAYWLRKRIPQGKTYQMEDKVAEFITEAIRLRSMGYDFKINHQPEVSHTELSRKGELHKIIDVAETISIQAGFKLGDINQTMEFIKRRLPQGQTLVDESHAITALLLREEGYGFEVVFNEEKGHFVHHPEETIHFTLDDQATGAGDSFERSGVDQNGRRYTEWGVSVSSSLTIFVDTTRTYEPWDEWVVDSEARVDIIRGKKLFNSDEAMVAQTAQRVPGPIISNDTSEVGGIDLNPNNFEIETRGDNQNIHIQFDLEKLQELNIQGFVPVIINITPILNIPLLLGISDDQEREQEQTAQDLEQSPVDRKERFSFQSAEELSRL
ncbi:MAG: PfkB family carbohydrate kinase [Candidatus Omnitrophota bacterium]